MKIKSLPERERPVEKACAEGIEALSNSELLALIINTGTKTKSAIGLAEDLLCSFSNGLSDLSGCILEDLTVIDGIGVKKGCTILASIELGRRIAASRTLDKKVIQSPDDVAELLMEDLRYKKKEYFISILLNAKGEIMNIDQVSVGELSSTVVHPREVFNMAVRKSAAAVIFAHNHPSGDCQPSNEDKVTTKRLVEAGKILGINVMDHIIIGDGTFCSMRCAELWNE